MRGGEGDRKACNNAQEFPDPRMDSKLFASRDWPHARRHHHSFRNVCEITLMEDSHPPRKIPNPRGVVVDDPFLLSAWYPYLKPFNFETEMIPMTLQEGQAMLNYFEEEVKKSGKRYTEEGVLSPLPISFRCYSVSLCSD